MKLTLIYPPFCTPTVPPHSITYLASFISANSDIEVECLDLNAKFHTMKFPALYKRLEKARGGINPYSEMLEKYSSMAKKAHRENNLKMAGGEDPEFLNEILRLVLEGKPDVVGVSFVYNSQIFYGLKIIKELAGRGVRCVAGGPAANSFVAEKVTALKDERELLRYLTGKETGTGSYFPDFSQYPERDYLSKEMIYPIRSSCGCNYRGCAFCTHHDNIPYGEISLECLKNTVQNNNIRNLFFIDDNIPTKRLSELADMLKPLGVRWWCQTRPTEDLLGHFRELRKSGLVSMTFGVESGSQRMLDIMGKGTTVAAIRKVLEESHAAGIRNIVFVMFGFPGEDENSFTDTMEFLRANRENIDIISASVSGLQKGSRVYENPERYGIYEIRVRDTPLGETITYKVRHGLGEKEAKVMKEGVARELREMNRLPKIFCLLKEQSLFF